MNKYPIIKFTILFTFGILFQSLIKLNYNFFLFPIIFVVLLFSIGVVLKFRAKEIHKKLSFIILSFLLGAFYSTLNSPKHATYPFELPKIKNAAITGRVIDIDLISNKKLSAFVELVKLNEDKNEKNINDKFILNIWNDTSGTLNQIYKDLRIGDIIEFKGTVSRAKNERNPGEFDYEKYLNEIGVSGIINCYKPEDIKVINQQSYLFKNLVHSARKAVDHKIRELHDPSSSALLKGILLADRKDIDYEVRSSFVDSGVIHVLAVSGLHVGFIAGIFFLLFGRFNIRVKYSLTIIGIILFLILTGGHASVFRASIMAIVLLIAKLLGRSTNGFNSISIAALILLILNPSELFNPGFQLSFSAVLSILIIYPLLSEKINKLSQTKYLKNLLLFISVSIAAQLGTMPFTLVYFNKLSLISIFANLIVIPIIGLIVALGIITLVCSLFYLNLASVFASANILIIQLMYYFVDQTSNLSFSFLPIFNFSILDGIIFYSVLIFILFILKNYQNKILLILSILISFIALQNFIVLDNEKLLPDGKLSVVAIDVGQGDAILIKFPNLKTALIDAGNCTEYFDNGERVIYPLLQKLGIDRLNTVFISHMDSDHYAGILSLVEKNIIDTVYKPYDPDSIKDRIFEEFVLANDIKCKYYSEGSINIGGVQIYLLTDTSQTVYKNFDSNNKSGIIKLIYGQNSFLFAGDAEAEAEEYLVSLYGRFLKADVLKIGHHGSKTSSSDEFINFVDPKIGIISAGVMNKFNHPSKKILKKYMNKNVLIYRTDYEGAIILTSDGVEISKTDWRK